MNNKSSWGCWHFSEKTSILLSSCKNTITDEDDEIFSQVFNNLASFRESTDNLQKKECFLNDAEDSQDLLNDFSSDEELPNRSIENHVINNVQSNIDQFPKISSAEDQNEVQQIDCHNIAMNLVTIVTDDPDNIQKILCLLNNLSSENLSQIINEAWNHTSKTNSYQAFIICISCHKEACSILCKSIILPWIKSNQFFFALETISPVISWLGSSVVNDIALPLVCQEDGLFVNDIPWFKHFLNSLTTDQKIMLLKSFLTIVDMKLEIWQLPVITAMVENSVSLQDSELELILKSLDKSLDQLKQHRNSAKIFLAVIQKMKTDSPKEIIDLTFSIAERFTGISKVMLKKSINKKFTLS